MVYHIFGSAYIKSLLNVEHFFAVAVLTAVSGVTIAYIKYLYAELQTYQRFNDKSSIEKAEAKADLSYDNIFKTIRNSSWGMIILLGGFTFVHILLEPKSVVPLLIGIVIFAFIVWIALYVGKEKAKKAIDRIDKVGKKASPILQFGYLLFLFLMVGVAISMLSLNSNREIEVTISEDEKIPIEVNLKNLNEPTLFLTIKRESQPEENIHITVKSDEMESSLVEVFDDNQSLPIEGNNKFNFNQSKVLNKVSLELNDFILEGKNTIEIKIVSQMTSGNNTVRMVTGINRDRNETIVTDKQFLVNP